MLDPALHRQAVVLTGTKTRPPTAAGTNTIFITSFAGVPARSARRQTSAVRRDTSRGAAGAARRGGEVAPAGSNGRGSVWPPFGGVPRLGPWASSPREVVLQARSETARWTNGVAHLETSLPEIGIRSTPRRRSLSRLREPRSLADHIRSTPISRSIPWVGANVRASAGHARSGGAAGKESDSSSCRPPKISKPDSWATTKMKVNRGDGRAEPPATGTSARRRRLGVHGMGGRASLVYTGCGWGRGTAFQGQKRRDDGPPAARRWRAFRPAPQQPRPCLACFQLGVAAACEIARGRSRGAATTSPGKGQAPAPGGGGGGRTSSAATSREWRPWRRPGRARSSVR